MSNFKLMTDKYEAEAREILTKARDAGEIRALTRFEFYIMEHEKFCEALLGLLLKIAENENPMYKNSAKLREMAKDLKRTPIYASELHLIKKYVATNTEMHLEGYVTFRMDEIKGRLDLMVYSLVKKLKFGGKD